MGKKSKRARTRATNPSQTQPQPRVESRNCDFCYDAVARYTCTGCKKKHYCGRECQELSWETHIFDCVTHEPIKSYHHLARAVYWDLIPTNQATLQEWGFDRAQYSTGPINGLSCLLGIYTGMIKHHRHRAKTLDQWRRKGILLQEIKKVYEAIPEDCRGGYYRWLLHNEHVFDVSQPTPTSAQDIADNIAQAGWAYATGDIRPRSFASIQQETRQWPSLKQHCYLLCGMSLNQIHPNPMQEEWVLFGFCVGDQYTELCIGRLYCALISRATFDEIYSAVQSSSLVSLFEKKGLGFHFHQVEQLKDVLSGIGIGILKSSWRLKQFVQLQTESPNPTFQMLAALHCDYGFMNCRTTSDFGTLLEIYQDYFNSPNHDCVKLHDACINGKLFEYLGNFTKTKLRKQHRSLLKNPYPLDMPANIYPASHSGLCIDLPTVPVPLSTPIAGTTESHRTRNALFLSGVALLSAALYALF